MIVDGEATVYTEEIDEKTLNNFIHAHELPPVIRFSQEVSGENKYRQLEKYSVHSNQFIIKYYFSAKKTNIKKYYHLTQK